MRLPRTKRFWLPFVVVLSLIVVILAGLMLSRREPPGIAAPDYGQQWDMMLSMVTHTLIPLQEAFVAEAAQFNTAAGAFRDNPTVETLAALQEAWRRTTAAWVRADQMGLERSAPVVSQIYKPPANTEFIEDFIAETDTIDVDFIAGIGSTAKGLAAIEYLIFDPEGGSEAVLKSFVDGERAAQRMAYTTAAVEHVHLTGSQYLEEWQALGQHYADVDTEPDAAAMESAAVMDLRMMTNKWMTTLEDVLTVDLSDPMGLSSGGEIRPELVKAPYSQYSAELVLAYLQGFEMVFYGHSPDGEDYAGYADGLDFMRADYNGRPLSQVIGEQLTTVVTTLETLDVPLEDALTSHPEIVEAAHSEMRTLLRLIVADMTSNLSIALVYSDNDGD
jgi:uncharacterized protein